MPAGYGGPTGLLFAILARMSAAGKKKLFLVDAMAHIYRAFYVPMDRLRTRDGVPTKVPYLFGNIVRRILKEYQPDYCGVVFDTKSKSLPSFRP